MCRPLPHPTCLPPQGIDLKKIADQMGGASGAELKACCTEAGMFALRERRVHVTQVRLAGRRVMLKAGVCQAVPGLPVDQPYHL